MNRRQFVILGMSAAVTGATSAYGLASATQQKSKISDQSNYLFGAYDDEVGQHFASRVELEGETIASTNLDAIQIPFRAHDTMPLSTYKSLSFGRRPHNQMVVCDFESGQQQLIQAKQSRHFYGHGCIQANHLFTTENAFNQTSSKTKGVIGIRDAQNFQQIGEFETFGIGPHDIKLMPDGKTLVVANGGIHTHPDFGRRKLNLKTMQPSLVFIDVNSGKKIDEYRLPNHQLSIRHLSVTAEGGVGVATQYQGKFSTAAPEYLLAYLGQDGLQTFKQDQQFTRQCQGYIGDLAIDSKAEILAATSSRGNTLSLWNIKQARLIKTIPLAGASGLCFDDHNQQFLVSNAKGAIYTIPLKMTQNSNQLATQFALSQLQAFPVKWDNHMMLRA